MLRRTREQQKKLDHQMQRLQQRMGAGFDHQYKSFEHMRMTLVATQERLERLESLQSGAGAHGVHGGGGTSTAGSPTTANAPGDTSFGSKRPVVVPGTEMSMPSTAAAEVRLPQRRRGSEDDRPKLGSEQAGKRMGALSTFQSVVLAARAQAAAQAAVAANAPAQAPVPAAAPGSSSHPAGSVLAAGGGVHATPAGRAPITPGTQHPCVDTTVRATSFNSPALIASEVGGGMPGGTPMPRPPTTPPPPLPAGASASGGKSVCFDAAVGGCGDCGKAHERQEIKQEGQINARPQKVRAPSERQKRKPSAKERFAAAGAQAALQKAVGDASAGGASRFAAAARLSQARASAESEAGASAAGASAAETATKDDAKVAQHI